MYAATPPGMRTSTRTSTRENALKQLRVPVSRMPPRRYREDGPVRAVADLPRGRAREPRRLVRDGVRERVDVRRERRGRAGVHARHVVVRAQLCARALVSAARRGGTARTSAVPLLPVLFTTWHRSGGPSSRNVAARGGQSAMYAQATGGTHRVPRCVRSEPRRGRPGCARVQQTIAARDGPRTSNSSGTSLNVASAIACGGVEGEGR
jgi:hypothetical protein